MKGKRLIFLLAVSAAIVLAATYFFERRSTAKRSPSPATKQRVYIIGLDGASWNLMKEPLAQGKLPNIQRLMQSGAHGPLKSLVPTKSPILWTSMATGKTQMKHGIGDFVAQKDGKTIPVSGNQRITKAFWNILSDYDLRVGVVNWWVTWPPEKINGFMVSDRYRNGGPKKDPSIALIYPPELASLLPAVSISEEHYLQERAKYGLPAQLYPPGADSKTIDTLVNDYRQYWGQDRAVREASRRLLARQDVDVFAVVFRIVDVSCHLFWTYIDPKLIQEMRDKEAKGQPLSQADVDRMDAAFTKIIEPIYVYADRIVGDFVKQAGPNTNFIICSDHGFKWEDGRYGHSGMTTPPDGVIILSGPLFRKDFTINGATLLDITPTLLYAEGVPLGRDMDGKVLFSAFNPAYTKSHVPTMVASHDHGYRQKGEPLSSDMDKEILDDFKSLGYLQ